MNFQTKDLSVTIFNTEGKPHEQHEIKNMHKVWQFLKSTYTTPESFVNILKITVSHNGVILKDLCPSQKSSGKIWWPDKLQLGMNKKDK